MACASSQTGDVLKKVKELWNADFFDRQNPNKLRSLLRGVYGNVELFHKKDGSAYELSLIHI